VISSPHKKQKKKREEKKRGKERRMRGTLLSRGGGGGGGDGDDDDGVATSSSSHNPLRRQERQQSTTSTTTTTTSTTTTSEIIRNVSVIKGEENFKKKLHETKGKQLVVVNFGASWCKHCHKLSPSMFDEAEKYPNSEFIFTDVDLLPETAKFMRWTPTVGIYKFGRKVDEIEQCKIRQLKDRLWLWSDLKETRFESRG
jgi:thioredoxin 1